jgi:mannose-6-phosphate isomerase-like protein (cupin superfamily)
LTSPPAGSAEMARWGRRCEPGGGNRDRAASAAIDCQLQEGRIVDDFLTLKNRHTGEILRMRRERDAEGHVVSARDGSLPPRMDGPPPHVHFRQQEEGRVRAGSLGIQVGSEKGVVPAGGTAAFPAGVVHTWWNAGDDTVEFSGRAIPAADLDRYLQAVFAVLNASASGRPSLFYMAHIALRHRHTQGFMTPQWRFSGSFFRWFSWSATSLANIAPVRGQAPPNLAPARPKSMLPT